MSEAARMPGADAVVNTGMGHHQAGRLELAEDSYRLALTHDPDHADALHLLGLIAHQRGDEALAEELIRRAVALKPEQVHYLSNLGDVLRMSGKTQAAIAACTKAIRLDPNHAQAHSNLGNALRDCGKLQEAAAAYVSAIQRNPRLPRTLSNLGNIRRELGQLDLAAEACEQAIRLEPGLAEAYCNLGNVRRDQHQLDAAISACQTAIRLQPKLALAHCVLALALAETGDLDSALAACDRAISLAPDDPKLGSIRLFLFQHHPSCTASINLREHQQWEQRHARPLLAPPHSRHDNDPDPDRRIRIGYVSGDFRFHPAGRFLLPLLASHDHANFEIVCYANVMRPDSMTRRLAGLADSWRNIAAVSDRRVAEMIREDRIDLLVDLSQHTAANRLAVFARKPAPVQVTWLGFLGTTGLSTIDYRFTDPHLDPPGEGDANYSENSIRLPYSFWCWDPIELFPEMNPLPALTRGSLTFGSFNSFAKVTPPTLELWADVLSAVGGSRMMIHSHPGSHRDRLLDRLSRRGIESSRIEFIPRQAFGEYVREYHRIDLCLDAFPYNAGTISFDALWMGVPTIALRGETALARVGVSILSNAGLPDWIAQTPQQYVSIAVEAARDLPRLAALRSGLRERMSQRPFMQPKSFAAGVEAAYREMWRKWCASRS